MTALPTAGPAAMPPVRVERYETLVVGGGQAGLLGRDIYAWTWPLAQRLTLDTPLGRRLGAHARGGDPLVGHSAEALAAAGVVRVGRVTDARGGLPVCEGEALSPRVVVWCTGYTADYGWIDLPVLDGAGRPRHQRGVVADAPGLYFVGLRFQHRMTSSLLGGVGADAAYVAGQVAARCEAAYAAEVADEVWPGG
jgi:putative flavoprotein involved in K+ transport